MQSLFKSYLPNELRSAIYPIEQVDISHFIDHPTYLLSAKNSIKSHLTEKELVGLHLLIGDEAVGKTTFVTNLAIQNIIKGNGLFFTDLYGKKQTLERIKHAVDFANRGSDLIEIDISVDRLATNGKTKFLEKVRELERVNWKDIISNKKILLITGNLKDTEYSPNFVYYLREIFADLVKDLTSVFNKKHLINKNLFLIHLDEAELYVDTHNYLHKLTTLAEHNKLCLMCSFKVFNTYYTHIYGIEINHSEMAHLYKMGHSYLFRLTDYYSLAFLETKLDKYTLNRVKRLQLGEYIIPAHHNRKEETFLIV